METIGIRIKPADLEILDLAAEEAEEDRSEFIRTAAMRRAERKSKMGETDR